MRFFFLSGDKKSLISRNPSADMRRKVFKLNDSAKYDWEIGGWGSHLLLGELP